ncbi:MAG: carotenoid 1,2-hydratase [Burkholderiaceae bacterium]
MGGPGFDTALGPGGYAWWYLDALSDDGRHAVTTIAFIGSVFSPYYARARRRGRAEPEDHVAINLALYGQGPRRWTMTERGRPALHRDAHQLAIGPSSLRWVDGALEATIDEWAVPWPSRVRGRIRIEPQLSPGQFFVLDETGQHRWQPIAPRARVTVELQAPRLAWSGEGYLDANWGEAPLESCFAGWHWSRSALPDGGSLISYDTRPRQGAPRRLNLRVLPGGVVVSVPARAAKALPPSRWGVARHTQGEARVLQTLEDGPFYARSLLATRWQGQDLRTWHESLDLDRFDARWVQALLPFRMPRRAGWSAA